MDCNFKNDGLLITILQTIGHVFVTLLLFLVIFCSIETFLIFYLNVKLCLLLLCYLLLKADERKITNFFESSTISKRREYDK